jgi:hypothetical protein
MKFVLAAFGYRVLTGRDLAGFMHDAGGEEKPAATGGS